MGSMKKLVREKETRKFGGSKEKDTNSNVTIASMAKRKVGWPRKTVTVKEKELKTLELSITMSVGGLDVDKTLSSNVQ